MSDNVKLTLTSDGPISNKIVMNGNNLAFRAAILRAIQYGISRALMSHGGKELDVSFRASICISDPKTKEDKINEKVF